MSKEYTDEQIREHSKHDDVWVSIGDKVYDVTEFLPEHPGGEEVLLDVGGVDATDAFEDVGHSDEAREMLDKMLVGTRVLTNGTKAKARNVKSSVKPQQDGPSFTYMIVLLAVAMYLGYRYYS